MPKIELRQVSGVYEDGIVGLAPTDLTITSGKLTAIVGPSGSGKTTLIRLIAGLDRPATGTILFDDEVVNDIDPSERGVGLVKTQGALYDHMTTENNIRFPLNASGVGEPEQTKRAEAEASRFGIRRFFHRKPRTLSAGERQLVATGRATVRAVSVLLFDEALAGVDPHVRRRVRTEFRKLHDGSLTIVYATNEQDEAMALADRLVLLDAGEVQQTGTPLEVYRRPINTVVATFLGSPGMNVFPATAMSGNRLQVGQDVISGASPPPAAVEFLAGIRPEDVQLAKPGDAFEHCLHARVTAVQQLGSARVVYVAFGSPDSGALDFAVQVTESRPLAVGDSVELNLSVDKIHYFSQEAGARI